MTSIPFCWQKAENKIEPKEPAPSDLVYVETRKRKPGRKYKVKDHFDKIDKFALVKKILSLGSS